MAQVAYVSNCALVNSRPSLGSFGQTAAASLEKAVPNALLLRRIQIAPACGPAARQQLPVDVPRQLTRAFEDLDHCRHLGRPKRRSHLGGQKRQGVSSNCGRDGDALGSRRGWRGRELWLAGEKGRHLSVRPLMRRIRLLQQEERLAPTTWLDSDQVDTNTELLRLLNPDTKVLVPRNEDRIADRAVPGKRDHVGDDQRINALLLADAVHEPQPNFHVVQVSEGEMLSRRAGGCAVIPIDTQKARAGQLLGELRERLNSLRVVEADLSTHEFLPREENRALGKYVTRVYEDRDSIHALRADGKTKRLPKEPL